MSILLVDDVPLNRRVLAALLSKVGAPWGALEAADGLQAVQLYTAHRTRVKLVVMDLNMPHLDGLGATEQLRALEAERGWPPVPIVACTSEDVPRGGGLWQRCIDSGMNDAMGKPVTTQHMHQLLAQFLGDEFSLGDSDASSGSCTELSCTR